MNNGNGVPMTDQERQLEINENLGKTCKYIMATIEVVNLRLNTIKRRLDKLEAFSKRSVKDE